MLITIIKGEILFARIAPFLSNYLFKATLSIYDFPSIITLMI